jgi:hypothetical protein
MTDLKTHCEEIAANLSNADYLAECAAEYNDPDYDIFNYFEDALDFEYLIDSHGQYRGARVLVAFGGPNIWINTRTNEVEGAWWQDSCRVSFNDAIGLDDALRDIFETTVFTIER